MNSQILRPFTLKNDIFFFRVIMVFDSEAAMQNIIRHIGQRCKADRCYFFRVNKINETMDNEYEWCAEGIEPHQYKFRNIPITTFPGCSRKLKSKEWFSASQADTHLMTPEQVKSLDLYLVSYVCLTLVCFT